MPPHILENNGWIKGLRIMDNECLEREGNSPNPFQGTHCKM